MLAARDSSGHGEVVLAAGEEGGVAAWAGRGVQGTVRGGFLADPEASAVGVDGLEVDRGGGAGGEEGEGGCGCGGEEGGGCEGED